MMFGGYPIRLRYSARLLIYCIILSAIYYLIGLQFYAVKATVERVAFEQKIEQLARLLELEQALLDSMEQHYCDREGPWNEKKQLFDFYNKNIITGQQKEAKHWSFDKGRGTYIYRVLSKKFFRSKKGHIVELELYCKNNRISLVSSEYQWCLVPKWWGCSQWQ